MGEKLGNNLGSVVLLLQGTTEILESANMHSFIQLVFECLLCARHCSRYLGVKAK